MAPKNQDKRVKMAPKNKCIWTKLAPKNSLYQSTKSSHIFRKKSTLVPVFSGSKLPILLKKRDIKCKHRGKNYITFFMSERERHVVIAIKLKLHKMSENERNELLQKFREPPYTKEQFNGIRPPSLSLVSDLKECTE